MNDQMSFDPPGPEDRQCDLTGVHNAHEWGAGAYRCGGIAILPATGLAAGRKLRDAGIARVKNAANEEWKAAAWAALLAAHEANEEITSDDLWPLIPEGVTTTDNRAMGAIFQRAQREKLLASTNRTRPSNRPETHANPKTVWRCTWPTR